MEKHLIEKYIMGKCDEKELIEILSWLNESEENAREFFSMEEIYHMGKDELSKVHNTHPDRAVKSPRRTVWIRICGMAVAAAVAALVCTLAFRSAFSVKDICATAHGEVTLVNLPDGSKVWLNDSATIYYPEHFSDRQRQVRLNGEAYFEVAKNPEAPFTVENSSMRVKVLGTRFNMNCSGGVAQTTLIEGEVEVEGLKNEGRIILSPGQRAEIDIEKGKMTVKSVDARLDAVWHDGIIPFTNATFFSIAQTLEIIYDVNIIMPHGHKDTRTYTGSVMRKNNVEAVLTSLQNSIPFEFSTLDGDIVVRF